MLVLALDTALDAAQVAVLDVGRGATLAVETVPMRTGQAEVLVPMIGTTLAAAGLGLGDIDRIAVSIGPGTFTGVRIALSAARALALARGLPVVGVSTLDVLADAAGGVAPLLALIDARRAEVYARAYGPGGAPIGAPELVALDVLAARHAAAPPALIGSGAPLLATLLPGARVVAAPDVIDVVRLARLGARRDPAEAPARPLYLRAPDAKPQAQGAALLAPARP